MSLAFLIGVLTGLRGLTPPAAVAWALYLGWMHVDGFLGALGSGVAVTLLTVLAAGELVGDKLPFTPARTAPPGLIARLIGGGVTGACVTGGSVGGALVGIVGALAGTFGGYQARTRLVRALGVPDVVIAVLEDAVTIAGSLWVVRHIQ
jgi:uncharacterized membrane protein